jgi:hypothetical protein
LSAGAQLVQRPGWRAKRGTGPQRLAKSFAERDVSCGKAPRELSDTEPLHSHSTKECI